MSVRPDQLNKQLVQAIDQMRKTLYGESASELTDAEICALKSGGFTIEPKLDTDPSAHAVTGYAALLATSLDTKQAAESLGVKPARVRQMLAQRTLYGIFLENRWHIPEFQFMGSGLVPCIGQVFPLLDPELHPLEVLRWFTQLTPDLESEDGSPWSPLHWLAEGHPVDPVIQLARHL